MSACFKPNKFDHFGKKDSNKFDVLYIQEICIKCNIGKNKIFDIISYTLKKKGKFSAVGFNVTTQEFWAKKIKKDKFILHFTLNIKCSDFDTTRIVITPLVGDEKELQKLMQIINNTLQLYQQ